MDKQCYGMPVDFTRFAGAPALPVAVTLLVDVDSYKHNTDW